MFVDVSSITVNICQKEFQIKINAHHWLNFWRNIVFCCGGVLCRSNLARDTFPVKKGNTPKGLLQTFDNPYTCVFKCYQNRYVLPAFCVEILKIKTFFPISQHSFPKFLLRSTPNTDNPS